MAQSKVAFVCGDQRTLEFEVWSDWLRTAAKLVDRHIEMSDDDDDPFAYNETASVAFLAAAGAVAGHMTLAECTTEKLIPDEADPEKIRKRKRHGRADLWLHTSKRKWAFEFKQRLSVGASRANGRLSSRMKLAENCAKQVIRKDDGEPVAGLIVSLYFVDHDETAARAAAEIERYAIENCTYCWRLTPPEGRRPTYFLFNLV